MSARSEALTRQALQTEHRLQALLDAIPTPIWFKDTEGIYRGCNAAFAEFLGRPCEQIIGASVFAVAPQDLADIYRKADQALLESGGTQVYESEVAYADGVRRRVIFRKSVIRDEQGAVTGLAGTMLDVTAQRRAEAELRQANEERERTHARLAQANRLASIGTLAAGVAHELNNPLTFVLSNLSFAADELGRIAAAGGSLELSRVQELLSCMEEAKLGADRMRVIVRDLRALARGDEGVHGPVEVAQALEYAIGLSWSQIRGRARLIREFGQVPPVMGSEARLGQVFLNLLINAAHAIPEGAPERHEIRLRTYVARPGWVTIEVSDTGMGMPAEVRRKVFDPFFTTKPSGLGTGLGLWVCHGLVAAHGGEIEVASEPGRGSTFRVVLPEAAESRPVEVPPPAPAAPSSRPRVLVVDDEPFVGAAVLRQLAADHDVEVVSSGEEALRRLSAGAPYEAVICDLVMPGIDGVALHAEVARLAPALSRHMLFISAGATTPEAQQLLDSGVAWIEKPFDRDDLRSALARVLEARVG